jgi:hypothetical protein
VKLTGEGNIEPGGYWTAKGLAENRETLKRKLTDQKKAPE